MTVAVVTPMARTDIAQVDPAYLRLDQDLVPFQPEFQHRTLLPNFGADDTLGLWQDYFVKAAAGLNPGCDFLEIGPGAFRLAQHIIAHLDPGRYTGVEVNRRALERGWNLLSAEARARSPRLFWGGNFGFHAAGIRCDFAWAHSVFTHLSWNQIGLCLHELRKVVSADGVFYATYFKAERQWEPRPYGKKGATYGQRDPFHYETPFLLRLAKDTGWAAEHIEVPDHPKGQSIMRFRPVVDDPGRRGSLE